MMPKLLPTLSAKYPGIKTEILRTAGKKLREALRDGRIDMLILPDTWPDDSHNFDSRLIYVEELVLAAKAGMIPPEFCTAGRKSIKPEHLDGIKFFLLFRENAIRKFCDKFFRDTA